MKIDYDKYDYRPQNTTLYSFYTSHKDFKLRKPSNLSVEQKTKIIEALFMRFLELNFILMKDFKDLDSDVQMSYGSDIYNTIADFIEDKFTITGAYLDDLGS